jgi:hypothetical protein
MITINCLAPAELERSLTQQTPSRTLRMPIDCMVNESLSIGIARQDAKRPHGRPLHFPIVANILASEEAASRYECGRSDIFEPKDATYPELATAVRFVQAIDPHLANPDACQDIFGVNSTSVRSADPDKRAINLAVENGMKKYEWSNELRSITYVTGMRHMTARRLRRVLRPHTYKDTRITLPEGQEETYWKQLLLGDTDNSGVIYKLGYHNLIRETLPGYTASQWRTNAEFNTDTLSSMLSIRPRSNDRAEQLILKSLISRRLPPVLQVVGQEDFQTARGIMRGIAQGSPKLFSPIALSLLDVKREG